MDSLDPLFQSVELVEQYISAFNILRANPVYSPSLSYNVSFPSPYIDFFANSSLLSFLNLIFIFARTSFLLLSPPSIFLPLFCSTNGTAPPVILYVSLHLIMYRLTRAGSTPSSLNCAEELLKNVSHESNLLACTCVSRPIFWRKVGTSGISTVLAGMGGVGRAWWRERRKRRGRLEELAGLRTEGGRRYNDRSAERAVDMVLVG